MSKRECKGASIAAEIGCFVSHHALSEREAEVFAQLVQGNTQLEEIAAALAVSRNTVRNHFQNIFTKTATKSKTELLSRFVQKALFADERVATNHSGRSLTVLYGDDNSEYAAFLLQGLMKCRFRGELYVASQPQDVVAFLRHEEPFADAPPRPDLILIGFTNGAELVARLRSMLIGRTVPILLLAQEQDNDCIGAAYAAGANSVLVRPQHLNGLMTMMTALEHYWVDWSFIYQSPLGEKDGRDALSRR